MGLVEAIYSGANRILAHFHTLCKGNRPFQPNFDWDSDVARDMADLDADQLRFIKACQHEVIRQGKTSPPLLYISLNTARRSIAICHLYRPR